jgi:hypothetical protein
MPEGEIATVLNWIWNIGPILLGAAGGYLWYRFVGCKSGACPITRNPWVSTIYGAAIGAMFLTR